MKLDTSAAPELTLLAAPPAAAALAVTAPGTAPGGPAGAPAPVTVGYLAGCLRLLVTDPRRWWVLVRFDPRRPVRVPVGAPAPGCECWLLVLPPGYRGESGGPPPRGEVSGEVSCVLAGAVTEQADTAGPGRDRPLSPGRIRVHGGGRRSRLVNSGAGYAVTLHARPARTRAV
jgi:hypothetical protein